MFNILRFFYLFWIALFGFFLFQFLVYGVVFPSAVSAFGAGMIILGNVIKFAISWDVEREVELA